MKVSEIKRLETDIESKENELKDFAEALASSNNKLHDQLEENTTLEQEIKSQAKKQTIKKTLIVQEHQNLKYLQDQYKQISKSNKGR